MDTSTRDEVTHREDDEKTRESPYPRVAEGLLREHWGGKSGRLDHRDVEAVETLLESWSHEQVVHLVSANLGTATSIGALRARLKRVKDLPTYEAALADQVLGSMLGLRPGGGRSHSRAGTVEEHGETRNLGAGWGTREEASA